MESPSRYFRKHQGHVLHKLTSVILPCTLPEKLTVLNKFSGTVKFLISIQSQFMKILSCDTFRPRLITDIENKTIYIV